MTRRRFDEVLPLMVEVLDRVLGAVAVDRGVFLRDATGRLAFYAAEAIAEPTLASAREEVRAALGDYARSDAPVVPIDASGFGRILGEAQRRALHVPSGRPSEDPDERFVRCLERRIVGADWLPPEGLRDAPSAAGPARFAFTSLKGGVGRSTALAVVASELARKGKNVLVIDFDLEAPGVGSLLLDGERTPDFGAIDYLVERNLGPVDRALVADMVGTSALTRGQGLVHVVPATGRRGQGAPGNYLAKLSRAMQEAIVADEAPVGLAQKLQEMVETLEATRAYDVVLIDVRAGLAELSSGPLLALDAEILIFVTQQRQTVEDLSYLLAYLSSATPSLQGNSADSPWRRLKLVHSKAVSSRVNELHDKLYQLFVDNLYEEDEEHVDDPFAAFNFDPDDPAAPHSPIMIPMDSAFADWDPVGDPNTIAEAYYAKTYGDLIAYVEGRLPSLASEESADDGEA
jgi:cellulose biosynthesis protein BcsQ